MYRFFFFLNFCWTSSSKLLCIFQLATGCSVSVGVRLSCSGSSFLRTDKNFITCETSVPLLNVVEIDKKFQPWTVWGGKEGVLGQLPLPYFQSKKLSLAPKKLMEIGKSKRSGFPMKSRLGLSPCYCFFPTRLKLTLHKETFDTWIYT